jgi:hypothetical protein
MMHHARSLLSECIAARSGPTAWPRLQADEGMISADMEARAQKIALIEEQSHESMEHSALVRARGHKRARSHARARTLAGGAREADQAEERQLSGAWQAPRGVLVRYSGVPTRKSIRAQGYSHARWQR